MYASFPWDKQVKEKDGVLKEAILKGGEYEETRKSNRWPEAHSGSAARDKMGKWRQKKKHSETAELHKNPHPRLLTFRNTSAEDLLNTVCSCNYKHTRETAPPVNCNQNRQTPGIPPSSALCEGIIGQ